MRTSFERANGIWSRRGFLKLMAVAGGALPTIAAAAEPKRRLLIGYTEYRSNLEGRHANNVTMRACVVREDGAKRHVLAKALTRDPNTWTQFAGWSPDGKLAIIGNGWESPENAAWEEDHQTFRFSEGWKYDMYLLDLASDKLTNVTAPERVSAYNTGLFFVAGTPPRLGFQALIGGNSHPFVMDLDGRNKKDISSGSEGFAYGFNASPDGARVAYHKDYQVYVADASGANARKIETGQPFNFCPQWSPDGEWVLFVSGEHYNCHPYVVRKDGTELRKVADRGGYRGVVAFLDVPDFHGGSSDVPVWSPDGKLIYFTAQVDGNSVELMRTSLEGRVERLTQSAPNTLNYHPKLAPDGGRLVFGSNRTGTRQLYVMRTDGSDLHAITHVKPGHGAMWANWQAVPA